MKKIILACALFFFLLFHYSAFCSPSPGNKKKVTIGVLLPLDCMSLREIVAGFKDVVSKQYPNAVFNIQNAQGDIKLQKSIIDLFVGQQVDIIVPIGTTATQMALSHVKNQPIISLAADFSEKDRLLRKPLNITGVMDEIGGTKKMEFVHELLPEARKVTIIFHNGNEKNFKEITEMSNHGKSLGIELQKLSINSLPELETSTKAIDSDSQAILVLKDHLIVSGIPFIIPVVKKRGIPLITSDEGSVKEGATIALGIRERAIGEEGGKLAIQVLQGEDIQKLPMRDVRSLVIFYNAQGIKNTKITVSEIEKIGKSLDAKVQKLD